MHSDVKEAVSIVVRLTLIGRSVHTTLRRRKVLGIFFGSYASYYLFWWVRADTHRPSILPRIVRERFLEAMWGTRFLQAVRDMILHEAWEWFFDTTRGARAILWSYKRYESDPLKQQQKKRRLLADLRKSTITSSVICRRTFNGQG